MLLCSSIDIYTREVWHDHSVDRIMSNDYFRYFHVSASGQIRKAALSINSINFLHELKIFNLKLIFRSWHNHRKKKNTYLESHLENEDSFYYNKWKETWERCWWRWSYLLWFKVWCISSSRNRPRFFLNQIRWRGLTVSGQRGPSASAGFWRFFRTFLPVARYLLLLLHNKLIIDKIINTIN